MEQLLFCHVCGFRHMAVSLTRCKKCGLEYISTECTDKDHFHKVICAQDIYTRNQNFLLWLVERLSNVKSMSVERLPIGISEYIYIDSDIKINTRALGFSGKRGSGCITCGVSGWNGLTAAMVVHPLGIKVARCKYCYESNVKMCVKSMLPMWLCENRKQQIIKKISLMRELLLAIPEDIIGIILPQTIPNIHSDICEFFPPGDE